MEYITKKKIYKRRQEIVGMFCGTLPPLKFCYDDEHMGNSELQNWIGAHRAECIYSTNLSIMDAAWEIAESQIENGMEQII